jgi:membrane-bound lytic murein transglycosylase D
MGMLRAPRAGAVGTIVFALFTFVEATLAAQEDNGVVTPGPEADPPGPAEEDDGPPTLDASPDGRRAVRGSRAAADPESAYQKALREFEESAFPMGADGTSRGTSPVPPRRVPVGIGKDQLPPELVSPAHAVGAPARSPTLGPEELRPDLPWLSALQVGDMPVRWDPRVVRYLEFYRDDPRGRAIVSAWLRDQGKYRSMILAALERHKLPRDLLYLCMIESSYDPKEYSRAGASGLWQFMPGGGRIYGLSIDYWVDERNDPEKSTEAAMLYLRDLYERFGQWHLALAAYNAGYGAVLKSVTKYNTNDFWALLDLEGGLPWESSIYVPKMLATALVGHNLAAFGFDALVPAPELEFEKVVVDKSVPVSILARAAGVDASVLSELNPELRRGRTPPGRARYVVRIPKGRRELFARTFPQLRGDWDGYEAYVVRHGERFEDIAKTYGITTAKLRELNGVDDVAEVRGGTVVVVPRIGDEARKTNRLAADDDLYHSDVAPGLPGDPMIVAVPDKDRAESGRRRVFYRVVAGDALETVASVLLVRPADLAEWNGLDREAKLQPRMVLVAFVDPAFDAAQANVALCDDARLMVVTAGSAEHLDLVEGRKGRARLKVVAKKGDTLDSIGRRYGLTKYDVARINRRSYNTPLAQGEELIVYSVVDREKAKKAGVLKPKKGPDKAKKSAPAQHPKKPKPAAKSASGPALRRKKG